MARYYFGGGAEDYVASNGRPRAGVTVTFWTARVGGTQVTDLLDADGVPITQIVSDDDGQVGVFQGPDGVVELWALAGGGRVRMEAWDTGDLGGGGGGGAVDSVNGRTGVVTGLAEASDVTTALAGKENTGVAAALVAAIDYPVDSVNGRTGAVTGLAEASALAGYQPIDSDLTAIAALTTTSFGRGLLALADAAAGRTTLGLGTAATTASTAYDPAGSAAAAQAASQPLDSDLTALAALSTTSYGRAFLTLADGPALRAVLGTGTADATTYLRGDGSWATPAAGTTHDYGIMARSGWYYSDYGGFGTGTGAGLNSLQATPIHIGTALSIAALVFNVTTLAAGALVRLGVYACGANGQPGALLVDAGQVDGSTAGFKELALTTPLPVPRGRLWLAAVQQGTANCTGWIQSNRYAVMGYNSQNVTALRQAGMVMSGVTGALPATFTNPSGPSQDVLVPFVKVA